jgi:hypothetical protein
MAVRLMWESLRSSLIMALPTLPPPYCLSIYIHIEFYTKMMIEKMKHTPSIAMFLSSMFGVLRLFVAAGTFVVPGCKLYQVSRYGAVFLWMRSN